MIEFSCPKCRAMMSVAESLAGELAACPSCGHAVTVPRLASDPDADLFTDPVPDDDADAGLPSDAVPGSGVVARHVADAPGYGGLRFIGGVHVVVGWLCCVIGVVVFALALGTGCNWNGPVVGVALFFSGLFQIGLGQLFYCVRDIAINSFYRR